MIDEVSLPGTRVQTRLVGGSSVPEITYRTYSGAGGYFLSSKPDRSRERKPSGWLYPKPYSCEYRSYRPIRGVMSARHPTNPFVQYIKHEQTLAGLELSVVPRVALSSSTNLKVRAEIDALSKLKDQKVNFGVALAEAQQTANFVGDVATTLGRSAKQFRRGKFRQAFNTLGANWRDYPSSWLGWNYAAKPLLGDVYGMLQLLRDPARLSDWVITVKGVTKRENVYTDVSVRQQTYPSSHVFVERTFEGCFVRLDYIPDNTFVAHLANVGLSNPLEIVWELVPFSFVADWFLPIGDWFSSFDAALGYEFLSGSYTHRLENRTSVAPHPHPPYDGWIPEDQSFGGSGRVLRLHRGVYDSSPIPVLPGIKNPLSWTHLANGLSLLATAFGRGR